MEIKINSQWSLGRLIKVKIPIHDAGKCVVRKAPPNTHSEILNNEKFFGKQFYKIKKYVTYEYFPYPIKCMCMCFYHPSIRAITLES